MADNWQGQPLPPAAAARLADARRSGTWTSSLSTAEFAAVRSVGFEPVGQVMGSTVHHIGWSGFTGCDYGVGGMLGGFGGRTRTSGGGYAGAYAPLVRLLYDARRLAISRLLAECAALGGDGVVSARLTVDSFRGVDTLEFVALGTAVRAAVPIRPPRPFATHLSGQDFAKLLGAGYVPVELALGVSIGVKHDDWGVRRAVSSWQNQEVQAWTGLVNAVRHEARQHLCADVARVGADGCVLSAARLSVHVRERGENHRDHVAEADMLGTAVARFTPTHAPPTTRSLAMLSLDPERRRAGRRAPEVTITPPYGF